MGVSSMRDCTGKCCEEWDFCSAEAAAGAGVGFDSLRLPKDCIQMMAIVRGFHWIV